MHLTCLINLPALTDDSVTCSQCKSYNTHKTIEDRWFAYACPQTELNDAPAVTSCDLCILDLDLGHMPQGSAKQNFPSAGSAGTQAVATRPVDKAMAAFGLHGQSHAVC